MRYYLGRIIRPFANLGRKDPSGRSSVHIFEYKPTVETKTKHGESTHHSPPLTATSRYYVHHARSLFHNNHHRISSLFQRDQRYPYGRSQRGEATSNGQSLRFTSRRINSNPRKRFQAQRRASDPMFSAGSIKKVNGRWANGLMVALFASWRHHSGWPYFSLSIASH
jgi:hypothetical protein